MTRVVLKHCLAATAMVWSLAGYAGAGYFPNGWGAVSKGTAGAGIALGGDTPLAAANNPAGIVGVPDGALQFDLLLLHARPAFEPGPFEPPAEPPPSGSFPLRPGGVRSDPEVPLDVFTIPQGGMNWRIDEHSAFALVLYANGGLNTTYDDFDNPTCPEETSGRGIYCAGGAGIDLAQFFLAPTYARQVTDRLRLGIAPILAIETIEIQGLAAFAEASRAPDSLSDNGHDYSLGYGAKLGAQFQAPYGLAFGAVYQTEIRVDEFDDYQGILPDRGRLDIPSYASLGVAWQVNALWTLLFDAQRIFYSGVSAQGNEPDNAGLLGSVGGPGFGWEDSSVYKVGVRYQPPGPWTWRAGYAYVPDPPVDQDELFFNILAQSILQHKVAAGASWQHSERVSLDLSLLVSFENDIDGANARFPAQNINASLEGYELDLSWRYRF